MAVTAVATGMSGAINYSFTTDTSADFPSVANSTYFYNIADKLVRYKDSTGAVLEIFSTSGGASGVWGISNSSGVYTYYTTLTLAMAAAVSGNVIEMFSDVTETGAVSITLKTGVNINGNGHTYTLNTTTTTDAFTDGSIEVKMTFFNITLVRSGTGAGRVIALNVISNELIGISCTVKVISNNSWGISASPTGIYNGTINGFNVIATGTGSIGIRIIRGVVISCNVLSSSGAAFACQITNLIDCYGECLGAGEGIACSGGATNYISNSTGKSNTGYGLSTGIITTNCFGISSSTHGIYSTGASINNSHGYTSSGCGIFMQGGTATNCYFYTASGRTILAQPGVINNTYAYSATDSALSAYSITKCNNCTFETLAGANAVDFTNAGANITYLNNCVMVNNWNNAGGNGVTPIANSSILNSTFEVTNAAAKAIYSASALTIKYANNSFKGSTNPISTTVTQGIVNTFDNQGNILI